MDENVYDPILNLKSSDKTLSEKLKCFKEFIKPNLKNTKIRNLQATKNRFWYQFQTFIVTILPKTELWGKHIKKVESIFGTGVSSYFIFIKRLMLVNFITFLTFFAFLILPTVLSNSSTYPNCTESLTDFHIMNFVQGNGWMETTLFFYGVYSTEIIEHEINESDKLFYNLPLAYVSTTILCFLVSLLWIVNEAATGFKDNFNEGKGKFYTYCNWVYCSWNYSIDNAYRADKKLFNIPREMRNILSAEEREDTRKDLIKNNKRRIIIMRIIANIIVLFTLAAGATAIYFAFNISNEKLNNSFSKSISVDINNMEQLLYEFLPSICIVLLNLIVPIIFQFLNGYENYSPEFTVRLTLIRTIFLRLFSLFVLYATLYVTIKCDKNIDQNCNKPDCWETFVGQQMYRLAITDLVNHLVMTFIVNYIRSRIANFKSSFAKKIGEQIFNLPKNVLDIVYLQTICWFGSFYAPFLPFMFTIIFLLMFYIKLFVCLVNSKPESVLFRATRSNSMFMVVLLVSFISAMLPVAFAIGELKPSSCCGPFKNMNIVWEVVTSGFNTLPEFIKAIITFINIGGISILLFFVLALSVYYYAAVISANDHLIIALKQQLKLAGQDKKYIAKKCINLDKNKLTN